MNNLFNSNYDYSGLRGKISNFFILVTIMMFLIITFSSCTTNRVVVTDNRIMAHWIEYGEPAPYDGILLNEFTYQHLINKAQQCDNIQ